MPFADICGFPHNTIAVLGAIAEPSMHPFRTSIDISHNSKLMGLLELVVLIDANGIYSQRAVAISVLTYVLQC